jgi:DNA-nicking Smr family endonuclease
MPLRFLRSLFARTNAVVSAEQARVTSAAREPEAADEDAAPQGDEVPQLALDGELDLHGFREQDVADVVREYVLACREHGTLSLRIVHGKGKGTRRRIVHAVLDDMKDAVSSYRLAGKYRGSWGATLVDLKPSSVTVAGIERKGGQKHRE